jgi:hypothetical protein
VLRKPSAAQAVTVPAPAWSKVADLDQGWKIDFNGPAASPPFINGTLALLTASSRLALR